MAARRLGDRDSIIFVVLAGVFGRAEGLRGALEIATLTDGDVGCELVRGGRAARRLGRSRLPCGLPTRVSGGRAARRLGDRDIHGPLLVLENLDDGGRAARRLGDRDGPSSILVRYSISAEGLRGALEIATSAGASSSAPLIRAEGLRGALEIATRRPRGSRGRPRVAEGLRGALEIATPPFCGRGLSRTRRKGCAAPWRSRLHKRSR